MTSIIFKSYKGLLGLIIISMCHSWPATAHASKNNSLFYQIPTLETLLSKIHQADNTNEPHVRKLINIQVTLALKNHPEISQGLLNSLDEVPQHIRSSVLQGIVNILGESIIQNNKYNFTKEFVEDEINNFEFVYPSNNHDIENKNLIGADYLWAAFYTTGNKNHITKIITFLNKFPLKIRILAAEAENREALNTAVKDHVQNESKEFANKDLVAGLSAEENHQFTTYKIIAWSLKSNRQQYLIIDEIVSKTIHDNPSLNFYKDIKL